MEIGIDLGGSHIGIALLDNGKIVQKDEVDIEYEENIKEKIKYYIDNKVKELTEKFNIALIGIAAPGNPVDNKIKNIVNLKIDEIDLGEVLGKYNINIKMQNDAKSAALAEKKYGSLKIIKILYFYVWEQVLVLLYF